MNLQQPLTNQRAAPLTWRGVASGRAPGLARVGRQCHCRSKQGGSASSGQLGQNVSSVAASTRSEVLLLHVKNTSGFFCFFMNIFVVNSLCVSVLCLFLGAGTIWAVFFVLFFILFLNGSHMMIMTGGETRTDSVWRKRRCNESTSPRGRSRHRTFQSDSRWCRISFAITPPSVNSDQMSLTL